MEGRHVRLRLFWQLRAGSSRAGGAWRGNRSLGSAQEASYPYLHLEVAADKKLASHVECIMRVG